MSDYVLTARVIGDKELKKMFTEFRGIVQDEVSKAIHKTSFKIEADAKVRAPIRTGNLRRSIQTLRPKITPDNVIGIVGTNVKYAPYQEFGTSRGIRPKWYMRKAKEKNQTFFVQQMEEALGRIIKRLISVK